MVLSDALKILIWRCLHFDNDERSLLEGFRRINPKPMEFLPPHDPVVAACFGKHLQLAAHLIESGYGSVTYDTLSLVEKELPFMMQIWVTEEQNGELHAAWQAKHLHTFDAKWLQLPEYESKLCTLDLSQNQLENIPEHLLWGVPSLKQLDISKNAIRVLPPPINEGRIASSGLCSLNVSDNVIHYVPLELFQVKSIKKIQMQGNKLTSLKADDNYLSRLIDRDRGEEHHQPLLSPPLCDWQCKNLVELNLSNNKLDSLPDEIKGATGLVMLKVNNNHLKALPDSWPCPMARLEASKNEIADVGNLHKHWAYSLQTLILSQNNMTELPVTMCYLVDIKLLHLQNNIIESLPDPALCKIHKLRELDLSGNRLSNDDRGREKYSFFKSLKDGLQHLKLANNPVLTAVPPSVCELRRLLTLDLRRNPQLHHLPYGLAKLKQMIDLQIDLQFFTKQKVILEAITHVDQRGKTEAILLALKHGLYKSIPYRGMKMIVVGPANSGKTQLLRSLLHLRPSTEDQPVNTVSWELSDPRHNNPLSRSEKINFTVWDLKGGDKYDNIQTSLYTDKCLYLLVWDSSKGLENIRQLYSWIVEIKRKSKESRIILVGTHRDKLTEDIVAPMKDQIKRVFEDCVDVCLVNGSRSISFRPDGLSELRQLIFSRASTLNGTYTGVTREHSTNVIGRKIPRVFLNMQTVLKQHHQHNQLPLKMYVTTEDLNRPPLNEYTEALSKDDIRDAFEFFAESGTTIPIKIRSGRQLNILDPLWLIMMQRQVMEVNGKFVHDGRVDISSLSYFSDKCGLTKQLDDYLDLIEQLEIAVRVDMNRRWFWIPAILPTAKPGMASRENQWPILRRYYKLPYTPPRFWLRLVSRLVISFKGLSKSNPVEKIGARGRKLSHQSSYSSATSDESALSTTRVISRASSKDSLPEIGSSYGFSFNPLSSINDKELERHPADVLGYSHGESLRLTESWQTAYFMDKSNSELLQELDLQIHDIVYWQEGIMIQHQTGRILVESYNFSKRKPGIRIQIHCERGQFREMGFIVDHIENLLKMWYPEKEVQSGIVRLVPCPNCPDNEAFCLNIEELIVDVTYSIKREAKFWCEQHIFPLRTLLPDVFLADLKMDVMEECQLSISFEPEQQVGAGGFGYVVPGQFDGKDIAVKTLAPKEITLNEKFRTAQLSEEDQYKWIENFFMFRNEVAMLSHLNHENIVKLIGWVCIQRFAFAMEFASKGDLNDVLKVAYAEFKRRNPERYIHDVVLSRELTYKIVTQTVSAVCYLHDNDLIYSDLKTNNVLVFSLDINDVINIKLADYGISRQLVGIGATGGEMGTPGFSAPEVERKELFDKKVDWYSFGMLVYHILTGIWPFSDLSHPSEVKAATLEGIKPSFNIGTYKQTPTIPALREVMERCWNDLPQDRPDGGSIRNAMLGESFLCLHKVIPLDQAVVYSMFSTTEPRNTQHNVTESTPQRICMWAGIRRTKGVIFRQRNLADLEEIEKIKQPVELKFAGTSDIKCMAIHQNLHFIATLFGGIHVYECHSADTNVDVTRKSGIISTLKPVESLCYQHFDKTERGRLFVGYQHREIGIFHRDGLLWEEIGNQRLDTGDHPCSSMRLVADETQLWIACGNKIFIVDVTNSRTIAFVDTVEVVSDSKLIITGMVYQQGYIWCSINSQFESQVCQYNDNRECTGKLCVDHHGVNAGDKVSIRSKLSSTSGAESTTGESELLDRSKPDFIQSLLVVDDTLWVGTVTGDIIVIAISLGDTYGDVLGVLRIHPWLGLPCGAVKHMVLSGIDKVVACQLAKRSPREYEHPVAQTFYQLIIWDRWDLNKFTWFRNVKQRLHCADY